MKLPRTLLGWKRLFWITCRRCVQCHMPLCRDWPQYDDGKLWCMSCGGIPHPHGFFHALAWNARAEEGDKDA
jgi:hypothetical protein